MAPEQAHSDTPGHGSFRRSFLTDGDPTSASFFSDLNDEPPSSLADVHNDWNLLHDDLGQWSTELDLFDPDAFLPPANAPAPAPGTLTSPVDLSAASLSQQLLDTSTPLDLADDAGIAGAYSGQPIGDTAQAIPPKVGTRFSKESLRILRNWLSSHGRHPFPTDEERRLLQHQTGLNKTQILNWLANARRRGKIPEYQTSSPRVRSGATSPVDIPRRAGTPVPQLGTPSFDPLQRWVDSPPEHEPATAAAIARAVASSPPPVLDPGAEHGVGDSESGSSLHKPSPASSIGTSQSSGGSAYSFDSKDSTGASHLSSSHRHLRRKRRTAVRKRKSEKTPLLAPLNTFQCTFCTETFGTKHTWQRHEKSLHLALERWVCAPQGPRTLAADGQLSCVFCGWANPDDNHIEGHNFTICQQRDLDDRTFHRKDHLGQHLRLVHNVNHANLERPLKEWKMETPQIRSVCGFCGISLDTWQARTDHLADHFKLGSNMAAWKGDWGFDPPILARLENAIAPYMIDQERSSPYPFAASTNPGESPRHAYELIKLELSDYLEEFYDRHGKFPGASELHYEACRIVFTAEISSYQGCPNPSSSWLRDLVMSTDDIVERAKLSPLRSAAENRITSLKIIGKSHLFERCPLEDMLLDYVRKHPDSNPSSAQLQQKVCQIIQDADKVSTSPSELVTTWFLQLARSSAAWLAPFRLRAQIPCSSQAMSESCKDVGSSSIDSIMQNYNELDERLYEYMETLQAHGVLPDDEDLRQKGLSIIDEVGHPEWSRVAAQNHSWLYRFKRRHMPWLGPGDGATLERRPAGWVLREANNTPDISHQRSQHGLNATSNKGLDMSGGFPGVSRSRTTGTVFFNEPNFDRWVGRQLTRWVAATMSLHNPNRHVPSDEELQHQARWLAYEDGDPWNFTPADNAEWLRRFKRDVGLLQDSGPGLYTNSPAEDGSNTQG